MKLNQLTFLFLLIPSFTLSILSADKNKGYLDYHHQITEAERLIADEKFHEAITKYEEVFNFYDFIFLRDYLVAAQIALYINDKPRAFSYLEKGLTAGLELQDLKRNKFFKQWLHDPEWKRIEEDYDSLHNIYLKRIDQSTRAKVHSMFKKDQGKAFGALFRIGNKAQESHATKKFAPHSEIQIAQLITILENQGYPGEKLIGNNYWMSTIISHHNSISEVYSKKDTLYKHIRPKLIQSIEAGQMSPYEFALIDDWRKATASGRTETGYGFLIPPMKSTLSETNELRQKIGLRTIELRNKLAETEKRTGMNFYLPDWIKGEIRIEQN